MAKIIDEIVVAVSKGNNGSNKGKILVDHSNTTCFLCNSNTTTIRETGRPLWRKYKTDKSGNFRKDGTWNGKWLCHWCYGKELQKLPDSTNNKVKASAKFRNKELSKDSNHGKGYIGEQIWCKVRGVKNCNIEMDNFSYKYDHSPDPEYGIVNTKTASSTEAKVDNKYYSRWILDTTGECDNFLCICMNKEWTNIERVYIIPKEAVGNRTGISIYEKTTKHSWYEKYRVDEKPYNEAYHSMSLKDCPVLKEED